MCETAGAYLYIPVQDVVDVPPRIKPHRPIDRCLEWQPDENASAWRARSPRAREPECRERPFTCTMQISPLADQTTLCGTSPAGRPMAGVDNLVFLASHMTGCKEGETFSSCRVNSADMHLAERYAKDLRRQPTTGISLLLYREGYGRLTHVAFNYSCKSCFDSTTVWGERTIWRRFPRLEEAVRTHPHIHKEETYLQRYYWFHTSLLLWLETFGHCYPQVKYLWRLEPDVLFAGTFDQLIDLTRDDSSDVLLPDLHFAANSSTLSQEKNYNHFAYQTFLAALPQERVAWSLVSIGRYSTTFLRRHMASRWAEGVTGYEEILLPTACLTSAGCRLSTFNGWNSVSANHVVFRVNDARDGTARFWRCDEFVEAANQKGGTLDLWHPVKDRSCLPEESKVASTCAVGQCPEIVTPSAAEAAANVRALRRRSIAWADRFRDREMRERPFQAQRRERDRTRLADLQRSHAV